MPTLAIIGTAGRSAEAKSLLNRELFDAMCSRADRGLDKISASEECSKEEIELISGGAAWADHVAVNLFLRGLGNRFTLAAPCRWSLRDVSYEDSGIRDWKSNPGGTANYYHRLFEKGSGIPSLEEIQECFEHENFLYLSGHGFHDRNEIVANRATHLLAFTVRDGRTPADGGTLHTWNLAISRGVICVHIGLHSLTPH